MAVLSLPLSFQNSFWSQDYRRGLEVLYAQLEKGVLENEEVVAFIRARAAAESALASTLSAAGPAGKAFARDDGASLHVAFRGLKEEAIAQGKAHDAIATELREAVAAPFEKWAHGYRDRLWNSRHNMLDGFMHAYEAAQVEVTKLKQDYLNKMRRADEAEDDARFAPIPQAVGDNFTTSPSMMPRDKPRLPTRTPTMTERISQRFKELRLQAGSATSPEKSEVHFDAGTDVESEKGTPRGTPRLDKGKGRAVEGFASPERMASPPPMSPPLPPARLNTNPMPPPPAPPLTIAGLEIAPAELSDLLKRARDTMPLRAVRFPLLGEYQDCFSGEDFASWLNENVKDFSGSLDHAAFAAKELTEKHNLIRRVGEFGNDFENADDAFYQFRAKAFELGTTPVHVENVVSPIQKTLSPMAEAVAARTTTFASLVSKALNTNGTAEPVHIRSRRDADVADKEYRISVRKLDRQRLGLEERVEETLKTLQKWELDRLRAVKTVLRQYQTTVAKLAKAYEPSLERSNVLIDSYAPEADLKVFIEHYKTGPFRPEPRVYESVTHDESDVVFGIDLRRWADSAMWPGSETNDKPDIPPVVTLLLNAVGAAYAKLPSDIEKRKTWVYDVPLPAVHHIREALNAIPPEQPFPDDLLAKYDAPVLAGAVKLWALELNPPLGMYEGWDELRKLYPTVGSNARAEESHSEEQHILELQAALQRLPRVHLLTLDAIVKHLKWLIDSTPAAETDESNEVYVTKLALTMGRMILRPKQENEFSIQDRHPTLLFMDLINKYDAIVPPAIDRKKRESQRKMPVRRRTRPVDMRMSRSRISAGMDLRELQAEQLAQRTGVRGPKGSPPLPPPIPSLPAIPASPAAISPALEDTSSSAIMKSSEPGETFVSALSPIPTQPTVVSPPVTQASIEATTPLYADVPPPPPLSKTPTPEVPPPPLEKPAQPSHPVFKEPPPETDDFPPRPTFKEPPPDSDEEELPVPTFQPPAPEPSPKPVPAAAIPAALRTGSRPNSRPGSPRISSQESSRSPSPTKPSSPTAASLSRSTRPARGPRPSGGSSVSSMVSNLNRQSVGRSSSPGLNGASGLRRNGSRPGAGHANRGSVSRVSELSRRTMASDAEDEVVER